MRFNLLCVLFCTFILALADASRYTGGLAELEIRQKISLYALAIDQKNFALLSDVFTPTAVANYPPNSLVRGLPAIQAFLKTQLGDIVTQHTLSSTVVDFVNPRAPNSTAYLVAYYFGQGNLTGQTLSFYGRYRDQWEYRGGGWKTKARELVFFPPGVIGNLAILGAASS
ncbi:MAG: hypothetical protein Q9195_008900 [Heterodermia aff. obscurata]